MAKKSSSRSGKSSKAKGKGKGGKKAKKAKGGKKAKKDSKASKKQAPNLEPEPDPEQAERMALLQLRIGRASHLYSMAAAFALATSGILLLLMEPDRPLADLPRDARIVLPWLVPIVAGAFIATGAIHLKWTPYAGARQSLHFLLTFVAFLVSIGTLLLLITQSLQELEPQAVAWVYPTSLAGISLTLISLAMTWRGTGRRKLISVLAAAFPMAIMVYGFTPIFPAGIPADLLILTFMGSAVAVQFSGSMLHIIASSTSVQSKELIRVSNDRLQVISDQIRSQRAALDYKERALRTREADVEVHEKAVEDRIKALDSSRKEVESLQEKVGKELKELKDLEKKLTAQEADVATREESLGRKEKEAAKKETELDKAAKKLAKQEAQVGSQEKEAATRVEELQEKEKELAQREKDLVATEKKQASLQKDLEKQRQELLEKEGELEIRERALEEGADLVTAGADVPQKLKKLEARLLQKEKDLSKREVQLRTKTEDLEEAAKRAQSQEKKAEKRLEKATSQEKDLKGMEKALAQREAKLEEREKDLERQLSLLEKSIAEVKDKEAKYEDLSKTAHTRASKVAKAEEEIEAGMETLQERQAKLEGLQEKLEKEREELTTQHQTVLRKEKELEARESELKLRQMEVDQQLQESLKAGGGSDVLREKEKALQLWEKRLKEKEQEMKARLYEKAKALKELETRLKEGEPSEPLEEVEEIHEEMVQGRVASGTPRLDDLLLGGIPMGSQVLFAGPAFVGKEVAILNFLAQGLKEGIPVVIVTTSRPPEEVAKEMGPILPSFLEYEQLGLVKWIDGSDPQVEGKTPVQEENRYVVAGAGDYDGIQKAVEQVREALEEDDHPYFRLAYLTLSTSLTQGNEKEGLKFVQQLVNRMRQMDSVALYAVESGMHGEQLLKAVEHQMDGAIHFKVDHQKNFLSVAGICDAQTRGWVEYKHNNRALMIGAFMLERIR